MVGLLWEFDLLVAFDATKSYNNGIKPGGAFERSRRGLSPSLRVLGASGVRWRSGGYVPLMLLGRTTGMVEFYATA